MKKLAFIIFLMGSVWAQKSSTFYVASPNGLSLREAPNKDSKRIKLLEYGTAITNLGYPEQDWIKVDGYSGRWMKVSTQDGKSGYVFDGYTLPIKVPVNEDMHQYFTKIFGKIVFEDSIINRSDGDDFLVKYIYHYSSGVIFMESSMYESNESTLINVELGSEQAYLLFYLMEEKLMGEYHILSSINNPIKDVKSDSLNIQVNQYPTSLHAEKFEEGPSYWVTISWLSGGIVITWGSGV
jgi:hypothetical protein